MSNIIHKLKSMFLRNRISKTDLQSQIKQYETQISELKRINDELSDKLRDGQQSLKAANDVIEQMQREKILQTVQSQEQNISVNTDNKEKQKLEDENEPSLNKTVKIISEFIRFCDLMKFMPATTVDECISIISNKIEHALVEFGVTITKDFEGEFNPSYHCIVDVQETTDLLLDNHIAKVLRPGYWYGERCLIPQDVIVFTVKK